VQQLQQMQKQLQLQQQLLPPLQPPQQPPQQFVKSAVGSATDETHYVPSSAPSNSSEDATSPEGAYVCTGGVAAAMLHAGSLPAAGSFKGELVGSTDSLSTSSNSSVSNVEV
jgi:hypothetical protein